MEDIKEISVISRAKIAWLLANNIEEKEIRVEENNERLRVIYIFDATEEVEEVLKEYKEDMLFKKFNSCFKDVNDVIHKNKQEWWESKKLKSGGIVNE